jgi:putative ABC transport system permease protein
VAIGLGAAVLVAVALVQGNLYRQIAGRLPAEAPALFFLDIQPQQVAGFEDTVRSVAGTSDLERRPTLRGRIIRIAGKPVDQVRIAYDAEWAVRGDRAFTYAAEPAPGTEIVAGSWWPKEYRGPPLISFDAGLAEGFGIGLGDTLTVNLLGREITGTVANLREIDWRSLRFDFAIIFSPGVLEGAPQTSIAAVHADPAAAAEVERRLGERFSNITIVRVRDALEAATRVISGVAAAIRASAGVTLVAGVLVVAGAIAAGRRRRLHDAVVFKVLGATRREIVAMQLAEHAVLGLAAGLIALIVGAVASWAIVRHVMGFAWTFLPQEAVLTAAGCVAVATVAGLVETWRVLGRKAAPLLRND